MFNLLVISQSDGVRQTENCRAQKKVLRRRRQQSTTELSMAECTIKAARINCINIDALNQHKYLLNTLLLRGNGGGVELVLFAPLLSAAMPSCAFDDG